MIFVIRLLDAMQRVNTTGAIIIQVIHWIHIIIIIVVNINTILIKVDIDVLAAAQLIWLCTTTRTTASLFNTS